MLDGAMPVDAVLSALFAECAIVFSLDRDTAGQERFRTITSSYYRGAHAVLIVFDVTQEESFRNVGKWIQELEAVHAGAVGQGSTQILLIANKTDLSRQRVVETHRIEQLAADLHIPFLETSAKTNTNVQTAFHTIASNFVRYRMREESEGRWTIGGPGGKKDLNGVSLTEDGSEGSIWKRCMAACSIM
jgi:small GTP-binding protein